MSELFSITRTIDRGSLVRYAGAGGDFNPIHYNERFATEVGLPGVIAHGMLTMGLAGSALSDHLGDPGAILEYGVRFTRPILVPDPGSVDVEIVATVAVSDGERTRIDLKVSSGGQTVLGKAQAWVKTAALK